MENLEKIIQIIKNNICEEDINKIVLSKSLKKDKELPFKIVAEKILLKGEECFQIASYIDKKVMHKNIEKIKIVDEMMESMEKGFKQCDIKGSKEATILMNKKKMFTMTGIKLTDCIAKAKEHNKEKNYILKEGQYIGWMYKLGLMSAEGTIINNKQKKFRQINRFLEMVDDIEKYIPENGTIVDMGCGKSYLTFAMYYYFNEIKKKKIKIKGFDLKKDVVENCNRLAKEFEFNDLKFYAQDIADLDTENEKIDMIITLHACDTATDYAMYHAVKWGCKVIMSVPCCQHELFKQIENDDINIITKHGILKERFSALFTDSARAEMLEIQGYEVKVIEFIDMEHTPKNIMIRGILKRNYIDEKKLESFNKTMKQFNVKPAIQRLFEE